MPSGDSAPRSTRLASADALSLCALVAIAILFWEFNVARSGDILFSITNFDLYAEFFPRHEFAGATLRAGRLPLWDPHQIAGLPFHATYQGGLLYPVNLLYAALPTGVAMGILGGLHVAAAGVFTYLLCREFGLGRMAAWLGGLAFMAGGSTLFMSFQANAINSVPWLPAALLCTARLARTPSPRWALLLGLCVALQFLAGRDYSFVMTVHAVGLFVGFQLVWMMQDRVGRFRAARFAGWMGAAAVVATGLAAAQALPTLALAAQSGRTLAGMEEGLLEIYGRLPPAFFLANLVNPGGEGLRREYFGWIPLVCFVLGFRLWGRPRPAIFASTLSLLALLLCFGSQTPLYEAYRALPLGATFRLPDRFVYLFSFGFALVAAFGLDRVVSWRSDPGRNVREPLLRGVAVLALGLALLAGLESSWLDEGLLEAARPWGWFTFYGLNADHFDSLDRSAWYFVGATALLAVAVWRAGRSGIGGVCVAILFFATADLAFTQRNVFLHPAHAPWPAVSGASCYDAVPGIAGPYGRHLSVRLPDSYGLKDKDAEIFSRFSVTHYDPLVTRRQAIYFEALLEGSTPFVESPWARRSLFMGFLTGLPTPQRKPLLDLLGARVVLADARPEQRSPALAAFLAPLRRVGGCRLAHGPESISVDLYENPAALPRAFVVHRVVGASSPEQALARLVAPGFDARREAVVEGTPPATLSLAGEGEAEITDYEAERVVVRVETTQPGLVVLADSYDPDWEVTIDGEPSRIEPTDGIFRGVFVPAGSSELVFRYRPRAFYLGAAISGGTLAVGTWLWLGAPGRRSSGRSNAA